MRERMHYRYTRAIKQHIRAFYCFTQAFKVMSLLTIRSPELMTHHTITIEKTVSPTPKARFVTSHYSFEYLWIVFVAIKHLMRWMFWSILNNVRMNFVDTKHAYSNIIKKTQQSNVNSQRHLRSHPFLNTPSILKCGIE